MTRLAAVLAVLIVPMLSAAAAEPDLRALGEVGRALFYGEKPFVQDATLARTALPRDSVACARCHGSGASGAQGQREAGITAPALAPLIGADAGSARRVVEAIERGESITGRVLAAPMPRFRFTEAERAALAAFLAVAGTDAEPVRGVNEGHVHLGMLMPPDGGRTAAARAAFEGLGEELAVLNRSGGLYGRQLVLHPIAWGAPGGGGGDAALPRIEQALQQTPVLALVGSWASDLPRDATAWFRAHRLPLIANLGPAIGEADAAGGWASNLLPSVQAQLAGSLGAFDAQCGPADAPLVVSHVPVPGLREAVLAAIPSRSLDFRTLEEAAAEAPRPGLTRRVLALHPAPRLEELRRHLGPRDCLWTLAIFSGSPSATSTAAATVPELVTLPAPSVLPSNGTDAQALWRAFGALSAKLAIELLAQSGRRLQPEALMQAQMAMSPVEPVAGIRFELSRQRRHALPVSASWRTTHAP